MLLLSSIKANNVSETSKRDNRSWSRGDVRYQQARPRALSQKVGAVSLRQIFATSGCIAWVRCSMLQKR